MIAPGTTLGRYDIRSKIGAGGMGDVYLARDTKLDRNVALKILPADVATDALRMSRFVQEAKAASALNHPNIITIYETDQTDSVHFIATEFIEGQTLRACMRTSPMTLADVLDIATQVASALSSAHAARIIHRDIKPENVMVRRDGIVKVLDFGLAKLTERMPGDSADQDVSTVLKTEPGAVIGTVAYMSPEQARGIGVDPQTDIWSLGVVLYEMAAGCRPFQGQTSSELLAAILNEKEPPPLARFSREIPAELERIVSKALRKERGQRYQTIKDMLLDLQSLKQQLEFDAKLERSGSRETSTEIKPRKTAAGAGLAAAVLALGLAGYFYFLHAGRAASDSIAVLPFANVSNDPNAEYLSDGITESIISSLSQLSQLRVMARSTIFSYKSKDIDPRKVGRDLGVRAVLTGTLIQQGDNLTVRTELVNVDDGARLWGQEYRRKLNDVFAIQEEIAKDISEKLRLKLTGAERQQLAKRPTENLKAFQYYTQGRAYAQRRTREDLLEAIQYFQRAIDEDRNYAIAFAGMADAYGALGVRGYMTPGEGRRNEEEAARTALALDANLAEAHQAAGLPSIVFAPFDFSLGDRELRRAIELSPSLATAHQYLGHSFMEQGRLDEGLAEYLIARELDPLSSIIARNVATSYYEKRDYRRALELLRQADELGPAFTNPLEIGLYVRSGLFDEALANLEKAKRSRPGDPLLLYDTGMIYAAQGNRSGALEIIKTLEEMSGTTLSLSGYLARICTILNEKDLAFGWLERGLAAGTIGGIQKSDPLWDPIRGDARFTDLLRRMHIPS